MEIHNSHSLFETGYSTECHNCWGCSCHSWDILTKPCDFSVKIESNAPQVVEAVERQAALYGAQIQQLENDGAEMDLLRIKQAWVGFLRQLDRSYLARISSTAFHVARSQ